MKRKYIVTIIILCIAILGMSVWVLAAGKDSEEQTEGNLPEEKIVRDQEGNIIGIDITDASPGIEYRGIGFQQLLESEQFKEYESCGLTYDEKTKKVYFAGMEVQSLEDNYEDGIAIQYISENWDEGDTDSQIYITVVRDKEYRLKYFEFLKLSEDENNGSIEWEDENGGLEWEEEIPQDDELGIEEWPNDETTDSDKAMQELYNRSVIAKEYADKEFQGFLDQFDSDCEILETSYGFYTSEPPTYIVGYKYSNGINDDLTYAYKISVDDKQVCTILEEGEEVADFLFICP